MEYNIEGNIIWKNLLTSQSNLKETMMSLVIDMQMKMDYNSFWSRKDITVLSVYENLIVKKGVEYNTINLFVRQK